MDVIQPGLFSIWGSSEKPVHIFSKAGGTKMYIVCIPRGGGGLTNWKKSIHVT